MRSIGVIHTPYRTTADVPKGLGAEHTAAGTIEIRPDLEPGLLDIEGFSHLLVIWVFDRADRVELTGTPPSDDRPHGVFATRSPRRPNPIGLTVVRLLGRDESRLHVTGVDMRRAMSAALCAVSRCAARSNACTDERYERKVTALSGSTDRITNAMMRRVRSDIGVQEQSNAGAIVEVVVTRGDYVRQLFILVLAAAIVPGVPGVAAAQSEKETDRLKEAATVLKEILVVPDDIPKDLLDRAECVIVFPSVKKVAMGVGGSYGRGAIVCRSGAQYDGP